MSLKPCDEKEKTMENASKALLIAGGILLAMMILVLLVYVATYMGDMAKSQDERLAIQQLEEFNASYLAYNKSRMYGTDVLTVFNKANNEQDFIIEVTAVDKDNNNISIENNHGFKVSIFKCEEVGYNDTTGRINKMVFRKIET